MSEYTVLVVGYTAENRRLDTKQATYTGKLGDIYDMLRSEYPPPPGGACNFTVWLDRKCVNVGSYS